MNLSGLITENVSKYALEAICKPIPGKRMKSIKEFPVYADTPNHRLPLITGCEEKTYKAVVIHDSFGNFLRPFLTQHFKKIIYIHYMNFENAKTLIEKERPDVVIDQRAARNLQLALEPDPELEQLLLATRFDTLQTQLARMDGNALKEAIVDRHHVFTAGGNDSVKVDFDDKTATVSLRMHLDGDLAGNAAVRLTGDSGGDMKMRICYHPGSIEQPGEQQCVDREFAEGPNELFFRIFKPESEGILSIVTEEKGSIELKSVTAISG